MTDRDGPQLDAKYVVFKREAFEKLLADVSPGQLSPYQLEEHSLDPQEFFVLRSQDIAAAQAMHGYAHAIRSLVEMSESLHRRCLTPEESRRLLEQSDIISAVAIRWQAQEFKKVPD